MTVTAHDQVYVVVYRRFTGYTDIGSVHQSYKLAAAFADGVMATQHLKFESYCVILRPIVS